MEENKQDKTGLPKVQGERREFRKVLIRKVPIGQSHAGTWQGTSSQRE